MIEFCDMVILIEFLFYIGFLSEFEGDEFFFILEFVFDFVLLELFIYDFEDYIEMVDDYILMDYILDIEIVI